MEIYLIRHTTPLIGDNICYGQSDLDVADTFEGEAGQIKSMLPSAIQSIYCSPLKRCRKLAILLFPEGNITYCDAIMEINCGTWELQGWNDIEPSKLNEWMKDFVNIPFPGGESFMGLYNRVINWFKNICKNDDSTISIITHAGVIRCIQSYILDTRLDASFTNYNHKYGSVTKLNY